MDELFELFEPELALFRMLHERVTRFLATESVIPERLWFLVDLAKWAAGVLKILVGLRYTLLPVAFVFLVFLLILLFTPPPTPLRTLFVPNQNSILYRLPWPYPFSSWILIHYRERKWFRVGCVGFYEGSPRWENYMKKRGGEEC
ncbi:hypothetical protein BDZ45DRAFT_744304 [Acephala macrosclerotiorum]|nr:hypothetical protein BDZ45DRAFT_744304 [Acephala macrosclerotiorum]